MRDSFVVGVMRPLALPVALAVVLAAACTQTAPPPPITPTQRAQLAEAAASSDAPEGLNEALAGIDANEKRHDYQQNVAWGAADLRARGAVTQVTMAAGGMGGVASRKAAKAVVVVEGKMVQAQVHQLPDCTLVTEHATPSSQQPSGYNP